MEFWALYLPAFHKIKENDEWWGEGFTEWDNVKKGRPLFPEHVQPQIPLNGYYDLSKIDTLKQQVSIANKYGIEGFVFYHYWFKDGKMLLEKPVENLLNNNDINIKYSFCWANEPWARTWDGKNNEVLMAQEYGSEDDWLRHIKYFARFFLDSRYHRIDGHPVLYIYSPSRIPMFDEMIKYWNLYLSSMGIPELYIVEFISSFNTDVHSELSSAVFEFEPLYTTRFDINLLNKVKRVVCKKFGLTDYQSYDELWSLIIRRKRKYNGKKIIRGAFVGWDNSPRKGTKSMIVKNGTPEKFYHYMYQLIHTNRTDANNMILINAWNEWGEGAMLEPTCENNYGYLYAIKKLR